MKPKLNYLRLNKTPILEQLRLEEALLRTDDRNWCIVNEGAAPAIVMGISGKYDLLVNHSRMQKDPVPVIRRFSGGGTVFINEDTLFTTFICNSHSLQVPCYPHAVFEWSKKIYSHIVDGFQLVENDYVIENKKFGGNAQYMRKDRWLHHSSLLWDYNPEQMNYLLMPQKIPAYRQSRDHTEFLCRLCDYLPSKEVFHQKILSTLHAHFDVEEKKAADVDVSGILCRPHRKATDAIFVCLSPSCGP